MVTVIGSLNIDYLAAVERLPQPGETIAAQNLLRRFGGKGANQAVAAARQGARVSMIGCLGRDAHGEAYQDRLQAEGIGTTGIAFAKSALTGMAMIAVDRQGENLIIVAPGANSKLTPKLVRNQRSLISSSRILLLQFEVPIPAVVEAIRLANAAGIPVVLNPSPPSTEFPWGKHPLDSLILNEGEAQGIFSVGLRQPGAWKRRLAQWHIDRVIVTRGAEPTLCISADGMAQVPTIKVRPVDTVGAGDAFAGTYVARREQGSDVLAAIRYANCAGALATLKPGAQEAIPTRNITNRAASSGRT
jgi:ribokinase